MQEKGKDKNEKTEKKTKIRKKTFVSAIMWPFSAAQHVQRCSKLIY